MKTVSFSFIPSWEAKNGYDVAVTLYKTQAGYEFKCDEIDSDCAHPMSLEQVPEFMIEIGSPSETNVRKAISDLVEQGQAQKIYSAIHKVLPASFVCHSTDWDEI